MGNANNQQELIEMTNSMLSQETIEKIKKQIERLVKSGAIDTSTEPTFLEARAVLTVALLNHIDSIEANHSKVYKKTVKNLKNF